MRPACGIPVCSGGCSATRTRCVDPSSRQPWAGTGGPRSPCHGMREDGGSGRGRRRQGRQPQAVDCAAVRRPRLGPEEAMLRVPRRLARKYVSADLLGGRRIRVGAGSPLRSELLKPPRPDKARPSRSSPRARGTLACRQVGRGSARQGRSGRPSRRHGNVSCPEQGRHDSSGGRSVLRHRLLRPGLHRAAWQKFATTPVELWSRFAPSEYVRRASTRTSRPFYVRSRGFWPRRPPT